MHTALLTMLQQIVELEKNEIELIKSSFTPMSLPKGEFFLWSDEVNKFVGFLGKGLVRYFVYKDDEEATFEFTKEGEFIADYQSFNNNAVSNQNIQAIEDCELLIILVFKPYSTPLKMET